MQGGDISNERPGRYLVTTDTFIMRRPALRKLMGLIPVTGEEVEYDHVMLNRLWWFGHKHESILELAGIGLTPKEVQRVMDDLDNLGINPFNYAAAFESPSDIVRQLPYRPELKAVIDIPKRALRYGSWYLDLDRV